MNLFVVLLVLAIAYLASSSRAPFGKVDRSASAASSSPSKALGVSGGVTVGGLKIERKTSDGAKTRVLLATSGCYALYSAQLLFFKEFINDRFYLVKPSPECKDVQNLLALAFASLAAHGIAASKIEGDGKNVFARIHAVVFAAQTLYYAACKAFPTFNTGGLSEVGMNEGFFISGALGCGSLAFFFL